MLRVRAAEVSLRFSVPASAKFVKVFAANASLPLSLRYAGGRWGAGEYRVGVGELPPLYALAAAFGTVAAAASSAMTVRVNQTHLAWLGADMPLGLRVTASSKQQGPYEAIGAEAWVSTAKGPPHRDCIADVRVLAVTRSSLSLQWLWSESVPLTHNTSLPAFVSVLICTSRDCVGGSGGGLVPNGTRLEDLAFAAKFQSMNDGTRFEKSYTPFVYDGIATSTFAGAGARVGTATISSAGGKALKEDVEYWLRVYAGNYYDNDNDGSLSGSEGFNLTPFLVPADFSLYLGGRVAPVTNLKAVAVDSNTVRLQWTRGGTLGRQSLMYKVEYQTIPPSSSDPQVSADTWTQAQVVAAEAIAVDNMGDVWKLKSSTDLMKLSAKRGCCEVYISAPRGRSAQGAVTSCNEISSVYWCIIKNISVMGGGLEEGNTVYFLYSQAQSVLGTPLQPVTNESVSAMVGNLKADSTYRIRVRSANLNEGGFETKGSNQVTVLTVGRPQIVTSLALLYMSGNNAVQLIWEESQGGTYCGDVLYRLFRQIFDVSRASYAGRLL